MEDKKQIVDQEQENLQKYEEERPLPKLDPSHEDIEHWGMYIDAFYRGHACKMFGIKNRFSKFNIS